MNTLIFLFFVSSTFGTLDSTSDFDPLTGTVNTKRKRKSGQNFQRSVDRSKENKILENKDAEIAVKPDETSESARPACDISLIQAVKGSQAIGCMKETDLEPGQKIFFKRDGTTIGSGILIKAKGTQVLIEIQEPGIEFRSGDEISR